MADVEYLISLRDKMSKPLAQIERAMANLDSAIEKGGKKVDKFGKKSKQMSRDFGDSIMDLQRLFAGGAGILGAINVSNAGRQLEVMRARFDAVSTSALEAGQNFEFVKQMANDLKLDIKAAGDGFATLSGSLMQAGMPAEKIREIFKGVSTGARALKLDTQRQGLVFMALGQMASKGVVSMEELRRQLGESMPGAIGVAAKAMDMPLAQFIKLVETGKLLSTDFLPRFGRQMQLEFGGKAAKAVKTFDASLVDFNNQWFLFRASLGQGFNKLAKPVIDGLTNLMKKFENLKSVFAGGAVAVSVLGVASALKTLRSVLVGFAVSNPIGLVVAGAAAAAAALSTWRGELDKLSDKHRATIDQMMSDLAKFDPLGEFEKIARVSNIGGDQMEQAKKQLGGYFDLYKDLLGKSEEDRRKFVLSSQELANAFDLAGLMKIKNKEDELSRISGIKDAQERLKEMEQFRNKFKTGILGLGTADKIMDPDVSPEGIKKVLMFARKQGAALANETKKAAKVNGLDLQAGLSGINVTSAAPKIFNINIGKMVGVESLNNTSIKDIPTKVADAINQHLLMTLADINPTA